MYKHIEELALNGWPALQTLVKGGWLLRFADGYTKRSNSVSPIYAGVSLTDENRTLEAVDEAEKLYLAAGQDVIFKITPFTEPSGLDRLLEQKGYEKVEPSLVKLLDLRSCRLPQQTDTVRIEETLSEEWLGTLADMAQLHERAVLTTRRLIGESRLRQGFATVYQEGIPVGCGLGVIESGHLGLYDIVTAPQYRSQGYGRQLVSALLNWGAGAGANSCYLQVVERNAPAIRLYDKFGFRPIYIYWYRVKRR
jgi:GNAT superfamily N-acetyltransferase